MMPTVRSVIAASTDAGSRQKSSASMSAKTGRGSGECDGVAGGGEGERRDDDLVTRGHPGRQEAEVLAGGPGVDGDTRAAETEVLRELRLEGLDLRPLGEHPAAQDPIDRLALLVPDERLGRGDELVHGAASIRRSSSSDVRLARLRADPDPRRSPPRAGAPARPTHLIRRAGTPATSAKSGTSAMTTDPAATSAHRPIVTGATHTARAPMDAPVADRSRRRPPSRRPA